MIVCVFLLIIADDTGDSKVCGNDKKKTKQKRQGIIGDTTALLFTSKKKHNTTREMKEKYT